MASQAQINANRKNAKKSTGPKTAEGKEASSQNAFKHGLFVKKAVVNDESQEEYDRNREAMLAEWEPVGQMENIVAERLVNLSWRLERAQRMQNQAIDYLGMEQLNSYYSERFEKRYRQAYDLSYSDKLPVPKDHILLGRLAVDDWANYRLLDRMMMYERRIESSMFRTMRELERLQKARKAEQIRAVREQSTQENSQPGRFGSNFKERTQFAPELMGTMSCVARDYGEQLPTEQFENKAKLQCKDGRFMSGTEVLSQSTRTLSDIT